MKKENHPKLLKKEVLKVRIPNLLVIIVERKVIQLMSIGVRMQSQNPWLTVKSAISKDIRHMNVGPESRRYPNLKDTTTTVRSMDIEHLNANPSLHGHQTTYEVMKTLAIGITIQDIVVIIVKNMDISLRTSLEHILVETTRGG